MPKAQEFIAYAEECERLAKRLPDHAKTLLDVAAAWRRLAEDAATRENGSSENARENGAFWRYDDLMRDHSTVHGTVVVEKMLDVPVARVYAAFADPKARANWGAPSDTAAFFYEEADFRVGGRDVARCGAKEDPRFRVEARYVDIVKERRVVWTETIYEIDKCLAANVTTLEFQPNGQGTSVKTTVQVTSLLAKG